MKKILTVSFGIIAALALVVSCNKVSTDTPGDNTPGGDKPVVGEMMTITATLAKDLTKVTFDPAFGGTDGNKPTGMAHKWQDGDKLQVTDASDLANTAVFNLVGGENTATGTFSGPYISAEKFNVEVIPAGSTGENTQEKDGSTSHLLFAAAASDVTDLSNITLTESSRILGIIAMLPAGAAATINELEIEKSVDNFETSNKLSVSITTQEDVDNDGILKVYANIPPTWSIPANTKMFLRFKSTNASHTVYTRYQEYTSGATLNDGDFNYIKINCSQTDKHAGPTTCDGTSADKAYLIADKYQLNYMHTAMVEGITYFMLVDDVDMTGITWTSLNPDPYTKAVNFNGNHKEVRHLTAPFFDDLNGTVTDLTISNTNLSGLTSVSGILANTVATASSTITNVDLSDCSIIADAYAGGLIGQTNQDVMITGVDVNNTNVTGSLTGGIVGFIASPATLSECNYFGGTIHANYQYCGGITGATIAGRTISISDCSVKSASLSSAYNKMGGAIGDMRNGTTVERTVVGVSGTNVTITSTGEVACYVGGFVGLLEGGEIKDHCKAYVAVTGVKTSIGGFVGRMSGGKVSGSNSFGTVSGPGTIGGFFGDVIGATEITGNESQCTVSGTTTYVGGFVGRLAGSVSCSNCTHRNGSVTVPGEGSAVYLGGFAGYIGNSSEAFTATISGCYVNNALVDGVKYEGSTAKKSGTWVGGFAGGIGCTTTANNTGKIEKCGVHGSDKKGGQYLGGFAGVSYSTIEKCKVSGGFIVKGYGASAGGFCGFQKGNPVSYCYTNARPNVSGKNYVGGFIGNAQSLTLTECYSSGDVSNSTNAQTGGMLGYTDSNVTCTRLIRWNHSSNNTIIAGESSTPDGCYVKTSSDNNFYDRASSIGWSTDGTIWSYPTDGGIPSLKGV